MTTKNLFQKWIEIPLADKNSIIITLYNKLQNGTWELAESIYDCLKSEYHIGLVVEIPEYIWEYAHERGLA